MRLTTFFLCAAFVVGFVNNASASSSKAKSSRSADGEAKDDSSEAEAFVVSTRLRVITSAHHTRLEVTEGEVRFRRQYDGVEIAVKAGYFAVAAPNLELTAKRLPAGSLHP